MRATDPSAKDHAAELPHPLVACSLSGYMLNLVRQAREVGLGGGSQGELARRLDIHRVTLSDIERGKATPSLPLALRIARELGQPVEALFDVDPSRVEEYEARFEYRQYVLRANFEETRNRQGSCGWRLLVNGEELAVSPAWERHRHSARRQMELLRWSAADAELPEAE